MHLPLNEEAIADMAARPVGFRAAIIDGKLSDAQSGRRRSVISPIDGGALAQIPDCDATDVDRAVQAARRAFEDRRWAGWPPKSASAVCSAGPN